MLRAAVTYGIPARLIFVALLFTNQAVLAQVSAGVEPGGDHPLLERFDESTVVDSTSQSDINYQLVLGNMRRIAGRVVPEETQRLRGDLTRITYEIPQGFSTADVVDYYRSLAQDKNYQVLFSCSGRDCGNSNYWANDVFGDRSLYGPERNQYYLALRMAVGESQSYAAIYIITRANRRQLVHVEIIDTAGNPATGEVAPGTTGLEDAGGLAVTGIAFDAEDRLVDTGSLESVARMLQDNRSLRFYVVAHLAGNAPLESLLSRSQNRAEQVRLLLMQEGVDGDRLEARGAGPLAPLCSVADCAERVVLVVRQSD